MNGNTPVNLVLSLDAVNVVLGALSALPYSQSAGVIAGIQHQTQSQIVAMTAEQPAVEPVNG
jgi:hypothetical protein